MIAAPRMSEARVTVRNGTKAPLPQVDADARQIKDALLGLLSNAVELSPPGSEIALSAALTGEGLIRVTVRDAGPGISPTELHRLRTTLAKDKNIPLWDIDNNRPANLRQINQIARNHDGCLELSSQPGKGTRASIVIPSAPARTDNAIPAREHARLVPPPSRASLAGEKAA